MAETDKQIKFSLHIRVDVVSGFCIVRSPHTLWLVILCCFNAELMFVWTWACNFGRGIAYGHFAGSSNVSYCRRPPGPPFGLGFMCDVRWVWRSSFRPQNSCMFKWARSCVCLHYLPLVHSHPRTMKMLQTLNGFALDAIMWAFQHQSARCKCLLRSSSSDNHNRPFKWSANIFRELRTLDLETENDRCRSKFNHLLNALTSVCAPATGVTHWRQPKCCNVEMAHEERIQVPLFDH